MSRVLSTVLLAVARGLPMEAITDATGLTPDALVDPNARIDEAVMPRLWSLLAERFPDEPLTLEMAAAAPSEVFGVVAHAAQYAADLRAALHLFIRYRTVLSSGLEVTLREEPTGARLELYHPADLEDDGHASELGVAITARLLREHLVGLDTTQALLAVEFAHPPSRRERPTRNSSRRRSALTPPAMRSSSCRSLWTHRSSAPTPTCSPSSRATSRRPARG